VNFTFQVARRLSGYDCELLYHDVDDEQVRPRRPRHDAMLLLMIHVVPLNCTYHLVSHRLQPMTLSQDPPKERHYMSPL
jgi:hypothetical protein